MIELYLMRHGETIENQAGILQGTMPGNLSTSRFKQVENVALSMRKNQFDILLSSDLNRAIQTATIISEHIERPIILEPLLRERDWGEITGEKINEVDRNNMPSSVESMYAVYQRAKEFLNKLTLNYPNKKVLAITHGLFMRAIIALYTHKSKSEVPRVSNTEIRKLEISIPLPDLSIKDLTEMVSSN